MPALVAAVIGGSTRCMELMLGVGRAREQVLAVDARGYNALMAAATLGKKACASFLLKQPSAKEQLKAVDEGGRNALMHACHEGHPSIVEVLLAACGGSLAVAQCQVAAR